MAFKDYFQKELFELQNTHHIRELQLSKLRQRMRLFYDKSPIIKIFLDAVDVEPEKITMEKFREVIISIYWRVIVNLFHAGTSYCRKLTIFL